MSLGNCRHGGQASEQFRSSLSRSRRWNAMLGEDLIRDSGNEDDIWKGRLSRTASAWALSTRRQTMYALVDQRGLTVLINPTFKQHDRRTRQTLGSGSHRYNRRWVLWRWMRIEFLFPKNQLPPHQPSSPSSSLPQPPPSHPRLPLSPEHNCTRHCGQMHGWVTASPSVTDLNRSS